MLLMSAQVLERLQLKLVIRVITDHIILTFNECKSAMSS